MFEKEPSVYAVHVLGNWPVVADYSNSDHLLLWRSGWLRKVKVTDCILLKQETVLSEVII